MTPSEPARLALYNCLGEVIGPENAETLRSSLPMQAAVELATKDDIALLDRRLNDLSTEFQAFHKALRQQMIATIGAMTALTGIFSIIVGLVT